MIREAPEAWYRGKGVEVGKKRLEIQLCVPKKEKKRHGSTRYNSLSGMSIKKGLRRKSD